jgi:hypothetical protein
MARSDAAISDDDRWITKPYLCFPAVLGIPLSSQAKEHIMFDNLTSRRSLLQIAATVAAAAAVTIPATAARAEQGNMDRALGALQDALQSLREATPNKGGHKEIAVQLIEQAISEVNAGIVFANEHGGGGR